MKPLMGTVLVLLVLTNVAGNFHPQKGPKSMAAISCRTEFKAGVTKSDKEAAVCLVRSTAANRDSLLSHSIQQSKASQSAAITEALRTSFGPTVEAEAVFKPFYLTGDFNGDGAQDVVIVVRIKGRRDTLPKDVTIVNPFQDLYGKATFPVDPTATPMLALAIIHGTKSGWHTAQPAGEFLLFGKSPVLILNFSRTTAGPEALEALMSLIRLGKQRSKEWLPPRIKTARKGDVIVLGTEAVDSFLYWNGKTYRWEEDPSGD
jgi:hypothetical protein